MPPTTTTTMSPTGRYKITITTGHEKGSSAVVRAMTGPEGEGEGPVLHTIHRNYWTFWFLFVEDHKNTGHDYLICGEDYQGHTVINLTTGERTDYLPAEAEDGFGWCITDMTLESDGVTLRAEGCYWACPYEYRFFDFTNPANVTPKSGIPPMLAKDVSLDLMANTEVHLEENGATLVWQRFIRRFKETGEWEPGAEHRIFSARGKEFYQAKKAGDEETATKIRAERQAEGDRYWPDDDDEENALWERVLDHARYFHRVPFEDGTPGFIENTALEFKSDRLLEAEARGAQAKAERDLEFQRFKDSDPIYALVKAEWPEDHDSRTGRSYQSQVARWQGDENPFHFNVRVHEKHDWSDKTKRKNPTAYLSWGAAEGEITADLWTYGVGSRKSQHPRTPEGFAAALAEARAHLTTTPDEQA